MAGDVKAAVMTGFNEMEVQYFPYPEVREDGALVRMKMCGICGTDKHLFAGKPPADLFVIPPLILGHENLGVIEEIGKQAKTCLLYTSDAADDLLCVDLGGRRIIKKKKKKIK